MSYADTRWKDRAACAGVCVSRQTDLFHPEGNQHQLARHTEAVARTYCQRCPVQAECDAAGKKEQGIWGGRHRSKGESGVHSAGRAQVGLLKPHGTRSAQKRHRRNNEPLCQLCTDVLA